MVQIFSKARAGRGVKSISAVRAVWLAIVTLALVSIYILRVQVEPEVPSKVSDEPRKSIERARRVDPRLPKPNWNSNFDRINSYPSSLGRGPILQNLSPGDPLDPFLISGNGWDVSPIVIERYRLIFFTIPKTGTTVFKQLFRRMMGFDDWMNDKDPNLPHNPQKNGLMYLYNYPYQKVQEFMNSPNWTRAVFVRDPKDRLLSAFLDKGLEENATYIKRHCCGIKSVKRREEDELSFKKWQLEHQRRIEQQLSSNQQQRSRRSVASSWLRAQAWKGNDAKQRRRLRETDMNHARSHAMVTQGMGRKSHDKKDLPRYCTNLTSPADTLDFEAFVDNFLVTCSDAHWKPQSLRMDESLWKHVNFLGSFDNLQEDTRRLLEGLGAWERYGARGWPHGGSIFAANSARHKTSAHDKIEKYYTPRIAEVVYDFYRSDYEHPTFARLANSTWKAGRP